VWIKPKKVWIKKFPNIILINQTIQQLAISIIIIDIINYIIIIIIIIIIILK